MTLQEAKSYIQSQAQHTMITLYGQEMIHVPSSLVTDAMEEIERAYVLESTDIQPLSASCKLLAMLMSVSLYHGFTPSAKK